jgi:sialic acid synthase SpsE
MPEIIVECGHNHNGDMKRMWKMIETAKECGASVAKFQLYDVEKIVPKDHQWYWDLERGQLTYFQWKDVVETCRYYNIEFMASVFDTEKVKWCEEVGMKRYKIASRTIYKQDVIDAVVATGKPIIASLGMYNEKEFPTFKADYLYCIAKYPTMPEDLHFEDVDFKKYAGFSDHTIGLTAPLIAMARGARIIEKHFTLDRNLDGADHKGSMEPEQLKELVTMSKAIGGIIR